MEHAYGALASRWHYSALLYPDFLSPWACSFCFYVLNIQAWAMTMNWLEPLLQVWELSDIDRDGMLDKDEFAVVGLVLTDAFYMYTQTFHPLFKWTTLKYDGCSFVTRCSSGSSSSTCLENRFPFAYIMAITLPALFCRLCIWCTELLRMSLCPWFCLLHWFHPPKGKKWIHLLSCHSSLHRHYSEEGVPPTLVLKHCQLSPHLHRSAVMS